MCSPSHVGISEHLFQLKRGSIFTGRLAMPVVKESTMLTENTSKILNSYFDFSDKR
jgi:hypothetical protein